MHRDEAQSEGQAAAGCNVQSGALPRATTLAGALYAPLPAWTGSKTLLPANKEASHSSGIRVLGRAARSLKSIAARPAARQARRAGGGRLLERAKAGARANRAKQQPAEGRAGARLL